MSLHFEITADSKALRDELDKVRRATQETERQMQGMGQEADKAVGQMGQAFASMSGATRQNVQIQRAVISEMKTQLKDIERSISQTAPGMGQAKLMSEAQNLKQAIQEEETALRGLIQAVSEGEAKHQTLRTQIRQLENEMARLANGGIDQTSSEYRALADELGRLRDIQGDIQQQGRVLSNDEAQFQGVLSGLQGVAGGFGAVTGAMSLFGAESEDVQRSMQKLMATMQVVQGVQAVSQALNKDSAFRLATLTKARELYNSALHRLSVIKRAVAISTASGIAIQGAEATATNVQTTATTGLTTAKITLTNALRVLWVTMLSNPITLVVAGIGALVAGIYKLTERSREAEREATALKERTIELASEPVGAIIRLSSEFKRLGGNLEEQEKWVVKNQKAFEGLGLSIHSASRASEVFVGQKDQVIGAFIDIAKARALSEGEGFKKQINRANEIEIELQESRSRYNHLLAQQRKYGGYGEELQEERAKAKALEAERAKLDKSMETNLGRSFDLRQKGEKALSAFRESETEKSLNEQLKREEEYNDSRLSLAERHAKERQRLEAKYDGQRTGNQDYKNELATLESRQRIERRREAEEEREARLRLNKKQGKDTAREREGQAEAERKLRESLIDLEFAIEAQHIESLTDASERKRATLELQHRKTLSDIERHRAELLRNKNNKPEEVDTLINLETQRAERAKANAEAKMLQEEAETLNAYLRQYGTYEEKKQAIRAEAERKLQSASTEGERLSITAKLSEDLSRLEQDYGHLTTSISRLFGDLSDKSRGELLRLAEEAKQLHDYLTSGVFEEVGTSGLDRFGNTKEAFTRLASSPKELESIAKQTKEIERRAIEAGGAFSKLAHGVREVFESGDNAQKLEQGLSDISGALGEVQSGLSFVSDTFSTLAEATGSSALEGLADGINVANEAIGAAQKGMQAGAMFGPVGAAIGGAVGAVTSLIGSFSKMKDARHERTIQALQRQVEALDKSYKRLGREVERAYSADASQMIRQQDQLLRQKQALLRAQMAEEQSKKKSDDGKVRQYQDGIEAISETLEANAERAKDVIFGSDIKTAINDFANAYAEAWAKGNDRAEASKDFVRKQIRGMINELIKAKASSAIGALRDKLREFFRDEIIDANEERAVTEMSERIQRDMDRLLERNKRHLEAENGGSISGTKRGFETMSQDVATELNGRFTAIQQDVRGLSLTMSELRTLHVQSLNHLEGINRNTRQLYEMNERLGVIERNTRGLR